jgi:hypothetical protein
VAQVEEASAIPPRWCDRYFHGRDHLFGIGLWKMGAESVLGCSGDTDVLDAEQSGHLNRRTQSYGRKEA